MGSERLYQCLQMLPWYYIPDKWEYQVAIQDLKSCKKILEIGSGPGYFLKKILDHGLQVQGVELNQEAVSKGQKQGIPIEKKELKFLAREHSECFDGICSFQVLEHTNQPREFIEECLQLLKPGGQLIFCVPNMNSFLQYQYNLLDLPPHHMTRWSTKAFQSLEGIFPIRLEKIRFEPLAEYHINSFLSLYTQQFRYQSLAFKPLLNRMTLPIYKFILKAGARKLFRGQGIYAKFQKLECKP
jgi:SAM-dependent methyltransferase